MIAALRSAAFAGVLLAPVAAAAGPVFTEHAAALGIDHRYTGGWEHFVGGGVAVFDCDGDDRPEIFAAGGASPAVLLRNRTVGGAFAFAEETPEALTRTGVTGAYPVDIDSDGQPDLAILSVGENVLMRGLPDCRFEPFEIGFASSARWTTAFSATWEGDAQLPTLAFGNYVDRANPDGPFEACDANRLYRPDGARYTGSVPLMPGFCALSMLFSDWSRRGVADLRVSNDRHYYVRGGAEQLWDMSGAPRLYTARDGWQRTAIWGMGIASRDLTGDGLPEIFLTSMGDQKLHTLMGDGAAPTYADAPYAKGITAHRPHTGGDGRPSTGWHAAFGDVDNDGRDDIFIAKGNVEAMPGSALADPNTLLMQRPDGTFAEAGAQTGLASMARGRGAAVVDLDLDGWLDVVVVNRNAPLEIYRNDMTRGANALLFRLEQPAPNAFAAGAVVELRSGGRVQTREITIGGGHAGGVLGYEHFGLGQAAHAELRVIWPDDAVSDWTTVTSGARYHLRRGKSAALSVRSLPLGLRHR